MIHLSMLRARPVQHAIESIDEAARLLRAVDPAAAEAVNVPYVRQAIDSLTQAHRSLVAAGGQDLAAMPVTVAPVLDASTSVIAALHTKAGEGLKPAWMRDPGHSTYLAHLGTDGARFELSKLADVRAGLASIRRDVDAHAAWSETTQGNVAILKALPIAVTATLGAGYGIPQLMSVG